MASITTNTDSRLEAFKTGAQQRTKDPSGVNGRRLLSVLVDSSTSGAARRHVRESKMRQFGELEAVIMDRLWQSGRPVLVREVLDDLRKDRPLAYTPR